MKGEVGFMLTKDDTLKAVYSTDLDCLLSNLGLLEKFNNGNCTCRFCHTTISRDNLYGIVPSGEIEFCCNHPACVLSLSEEAKQ